MTALCNRDTNIDIAREREMLMTLIQLLLVLMMLDPILTEEMPMVSRAHILITMLQLDQVKEL